MNNRFGIAVRHSAMAIVGFALASVVAATPISVVNFSFEDPAFGDGGFNSGPVTGWVVTSGGVFNPTVIQLSQGPTAGLQVGYSNNTGLGLSQDLAAILTANTVYTLSVDLQSRSDPFTHVSTTLELRTVADDDLLASATFGAVPGGTNQLLTASFFASAADPNLGENLRINLIAGGAQSDWDNVRLDATPRIVDGVVPEPATIALLGLGLAGLGFRRRRQA